MKVLLIVLVLTGGVTVVVLSAVVCSLLARMSSLLNTTERK
jgi:hypothetical protein